MKFEAKACAECNIVRPLWDFYLRRKSEPDGKRQPSCKFCQRSRWAKESRGRNRSDYFIKLRYNLSLPEWDAIFDAQDGKCAICGTTEPGGRHNTFHVDHNHSCCDGPQSCGECVRGLLCSRCNLAISKLDEKPEVLRSAADYLERNRMPSVAAA